MEVSVSLKDNQHDTVKWLVLRILDGEDSGIDEAEGIRLRRCLKSNCWDVGSLKSLRGLMSHDVSFRLHEVLEGASISLPEPEKPAPRSPELEERVRRMKMEMENREYQRMTENVDCGQRLSTPATAGQDSFGQDLRGMNRQLTMVLNTVLTVSSCFFFVYKGVGFMMPEARDGPIPILVAVVSAFVVLLADLYFIAKAIT